MDIPCVCSCVSVQACLLVQILQNSRMITGRNRKRWNRGLKRKVEKGIISEEQGKAKFIRAQSQCSVFEAKSKRSRMEAIKEGLFSLVEAVKDEATTKKVVEDLFSLVETVKAEEGVKKENREKTAKLKTLKTAKRHRNQSIVY